MRKYLTHAIAAACLLALIFTASYYVRKYQSEIDALQARISDAESERVSLSELAAIARQRATSAQERAALVASEEKAKREKLEADNRALKAAVVQSETERRELAARLTAESAAIPTLDAARLAAETTAALQDVTDRADVLIEPAGNLFAANRPALEANLRVVYEVRALREESAYKDGELTSLNSIAANLDESLASALRERDAEREAATAVRTEAAQQLAVAESCARQLELWRQKDAVLSKRDFWQRLKPGWQLTAGPVLCHDGVVRVGVMAGIGWRF